MSQMALAGVDLPGGGVLLATTGAINFVKGVPSASAGLTAGDSVIIGVILLGNATAATLTIAGCGNGAGAAANIVLNQAAALTSSQYVPLGFVNSVGPLIITASVANCFVVVVAPSK